MDKLVIYVVIQYLREDWFNYFHYCQEWTLMHNIPTAFNLRPYLNPWYHTINKRKIITISAFPSTDASFGKSLSLDVWGKIYYYIKQKGYIPVELSGKSSQNIENCEKPSCSLIEACKYLLDSSLHLSVDCGIGWIAAGYQKNVLGFYTNNHSSMLHPWSHFPINDNAIYLYYNNIKDNVDLDEIFQIIDNKLF